MERAYDRAPTAPIRRTSVATDTIEAVLSTIGPAALGIYVYLARRCNRDGQCWPSYDTNAEDCGVQRRWVIKQVRALEDHGFLTVERRRSERTGNMENVYHLPSQQALFAAPPGARPGDPPGAHPGVLPIRKKEQKEVQREVQREEHGRAFAEFWIGYPKKRAKDAAERAWTKLAPADRDLVLERLPLFVACRQWQEQGGQFIPHPATWLNSGDWRELPDAGRPAAGGITRLMQMGVE